MADEIQRLILDVQGKQQAEALRATLEAEEKTLRELNDVLRQNGVLTAAQEAQQKRTALAMVQHTAELKKAEMNTRGWNTTIQQVGYGLGDLMQTSGGIGQKLMSITNNVQFALAGFGAWGIAAGVAMTVVASVVRNFEGDLKTMFTTIDTSLPKLDRLKDQLKDIEDKPHKLAIDYADIDRIREELKEINKDLEAFDEWKKSHTSYERESGAAVKTMLTQAGRPVEEDVRRKLMESIEPLHGPLQEARRDVIKAQQELAHAQALVNQPGARDPQEIKMRAAMAEEAKEHLEEAREKARIAYGQAAKESQQKAGHLFHAAGEGDQQAQADLAKMLQQSGHGLLASRVTQQSAAMMKQREHLHTRLENAKGMAAREEQERKAAKELAEVRKEFHTAIPDWEALSAQQRNEIRRRAGGTEAGGLRAFGEKRAERVTDEALHPVDQFGRPEDVIPTYEQRRNRMTPSERAAADRREQEIELASPTHRPPYRAPSPDQGAIEEATRAAMDSMRAMGMSPQAQAALAQFKGFMEGVQAAQAQNNAFFNQFGQAAGYGTANFQAMARAAMVNGIGGNQPGHGAP